MDQWWPLLFGVAMWAVMIGAIMFDKTGTNPAACPECRHQFGLDHAMKSCGESDSASGWGPDSCGCQNDYHWRFESQTVD